MSTESTRRSRGRARRRRLFAGTFAIVLGALAVVGLAGAAVNTVQGPRLTSVQVDPTAAVSASGSRVILATNQSLHKVEPSQVTVSPSTPFMVDTAGRSVGLRFSLPLHDDTEYTVTVKDVTGLGGGPATTLTQTFHTPALDAFILQRSANGDTVFRTDLTGQAYTVYRADHIEDFRATSDHLVMSTVDAQGDGRIVVTDLAGKHARELKLPGKGSVSLLQAADRGEMIGYTFSDADLGKGGTRESALYVASVKDADADAAPTAVAIPGTEKRVADWHFVPDTDSILVITYDGRLLLSGAEGAGSTDLGTGVAIDGIARGSSVAVVQRADGIFDVDLTDGTESALVAASGVPGTQGVVTPIPGTDAGTVRQFFVLDDAGNPQGTTVYRVDGKGTATELYRGSPDDAVMQTCVSPSGRYVAVLVAPAIVTNTYDTYLLPMPRTLHTHILELKDGAEVANLTGFDLSWCQTPPPVSQ